MRRLAQHPEGVPSGAMRNETTSAPAIICVSLPELRHRFHKSSRFVRPARRPNGAGMSAATAEGAASRRICAPPRTRQVHYRNGLLALVGNKGVTRKGRGAPPPTAESRRGEPRMKPGDWCHLEKIDGIKRTPSVDLPLDICMISASRRPAKKACATQNYANIPFRLLRVRRFAGNFVQ